MNTCAKCTAFWVSLEVLCQERRQQQKDAMQAPWDYEAQNRANAELMIDHPRERRPDGRALSILTGSSYGTRSSTNESAIWANGRAVGAVEESDLARRVLFDLDGCDREWKIFDISSYGDKPRASGHEHVPVRLQLDSGYYSWRGRT